MHQSVIFSKFDDFFYFSSADLTATPCLCIEFGAFTHLNTYFVSKMSASFTCNLTTLTAGTVGYGINIIFVKIIGKFFPGLYTRKILDGTFNGNNTHHGHSFREERCHGSKTLSGIFFKSTPDFRMCCKLFTVINHHFQNAGCKDIHKINILAYFFVFPGL